MSLPHETIYGYCWCQKDAVQTLRTLKNLCCEALVRDIYNLRSVLPRVPASFMPLLLARAVEDGRDRAAELLTVRWPAPVLSVQSILGSPCPIIHHKDRTVATSAIIRAFISMCAASEGSTLQLLDVTNYQMGRELIEFAVRKLRGATAGSDVCYRLRCDCFVGDIYTFQMLCSLVDRKKYKNLLRTEINNLELEGIGEFRVMGLLSLLPNDHLTGLSVAYNSLRNDGIQQVTDSLFSFKNLTTLDISSNGIRWGDRRHCDTLFQLTQALPHLRRLNLKSSQVGGYLGSYLSPKCLPNLIHLDLSGCALHRDDLRVLRQLNGLQCFILSDNNFAGLEQELRAVLSSLTDLRVLALSNCGLRSDTFETVWEPVRALGSHLHSLDISLNHLSENHLLMIVMELESGWLPRLTKVLFPFPGNPSPQFFEAVQRCQLVSPCLKVETDLI